MQKIKHILFPIDFSERCCNAVPFVESVASRYSAKVTILTVAQPFYYTGMGDPGGPMMFNMDELLNDMKMRLDNTLTKEFAHLEVERVAMLGDPALVITEYAQEHDVDLIMMPTHGYGQFRSLLLGSVTAKVLHDAECPVWTAAHVEEPPFRGHITYRTILCAVDLTENSVDLMKWANKLAEDAGASLRLVHVISALEGLPTRPMDREIEETLRKAAHATIDGFQKSAGINVPICIPSGNIAECVREEARRHGADLIVIGRGKIQEPFGRLKTHAYGIIRRSQCPVLSV